MKAPLTENGVLALYNLNCQIPAKVQVVYLTHWNMVSFLRVTDSKNLSPIMAIMKMTEKFIVGDIILIKKVQLQSSSAFKDEGILSIIDCDLNHIVILEYQVMDNKGKFGILCSVPVSSNGVENSYWNSLSLIRNCLVKGDNMAETFFREGEKRLQLLRPDCNLLRERGNELFNMQNYSKAILHYDMAKQKDHYDARVWNNSSQAYFCNNEYDKAKRDALVALKLDPFNKKAYYRAGNAMEKTGDIKGALEIIEAGLYVCGKCEELERILKTIKDTTKSNSKGKKDESFITPNKKKFSNGEAANSTNHDGATSDAHKKNLSKPKDSPLRKLKETGPKSDVNTDSSTSDTSKQAKSPISAILSLLEGAKVLYEKGKYKNAMELFVVVVNEASKSSWGNKNNKKDIEVVRYMIDVCKLKLKTDPIEDIEKSLLEALARNNFPFPPALHYLLANVYEVMENQDKVVDHANACIQLLEHNSNSFCLFWPGTKDPIPETSPDELKKWFNQGTWRSAPVARCRHVDCISVQNHSLAKTEIYTSDIDFRGYVEVECEEICSICYHPCCWKALKEQAEDRQPLKKTDKDFLGLQCFTPDCTGKISSIKIYDETSHLRNEVAKDKKEKRNSANSKPKKKKDKAKSNFGTKVDDKKKYKFSNADDNKTENGLEIVKEETSILKKANAEKSNPVEQMNFEGSNYKVLKPNNIENDDYLLQQASKKNKAKKKKKAKQVTQINIGYDIDDKFVHNDYLTRLRALKAQREVFESDGGHQTSNDIGRLRYLPQCVLDPERPFYLPQHLQENPAQLESILRAKMVTTSSSDIDKESIATLLEFMYDWLKAHSPMLITDSRIKDYISENFPANAVDYVNKCGGVRNFLLQSFRFALIDEVVCVNEQVVAAQKMAVNVVLDKFRISKYMISDGQKGMKLSHLLDDTKSTCSSNSSLSANVLAATTGSATAAEVLSTPPKYNGVPTPVPPPVPAPIHVSSPTSYKNAALGKLPPREQDIRAADIKPKIETVTPSKEIEKSVKKPKLKTMDNIDAFEAIEPVDMGQLFTPLSNSSNETIHKTMADAVKGEIFFHSDEEQENEACNNSFQAIPSSKPLGPNVSELMEKMGGLQSELQGKVDTLNRMSEEKNLLGAQNQELNDRLLQLKTKSSVEISALKKSSEDALEQSKMAKSSLESYKAQKEGEIRKLAGEKVRLQEELKAYSLKVDSLQLSIDQLNAQKAQLDEEVNQKSIHLRDQQMRMLKFKETAEAEVARAKDAESKYLSMKKDLIELSLKKTKKRLTAEMNKMHELLQDATEETYPSKSLIARSISDWDEAISKLNNMLQTVTEDGNKFLECIRNGRPLNALPPGDLMIPTIPDRTVAHLLFVGKKSLDIPKPADKVTTNSTGGGFMRMGQHNPFSGVHSQHGFGSGSAFRLGQLGVTPTMGGPSHLDSGGHGPFSSHNDGSLLGGGMSGQRFGGIPTSAVGDVPIGMGMGSRLGESGVFNMNGVTPPSLSSLIGDELKKGGSSDSSPIPMPIPPPPMTSLSGTNDFTPTYSMGSKTPSSDSNQIFVGQLPWNFTEDNLKPISYGNHTLNIQAKEIKRPSKVLLPTPAPSSVLGQVSADMPLIPPHTSSLNLPISQNQPTAFGLHSLLEASSRAEARTVATPTTPTATKPKFQNLRSNTTIGAIGTLPPKVVRPIPRPGTNAVGSGIASGLQAMSKEDSVVNSNAYKRLTDACKLRFGNEYPESLIGKAIREVREQNKNSLSGLSMDTILEYIEGQLRMHKRLPPKPSVAPWAGITQTEGLEMPPQWQGPVRGTMDSIGEDHCAICIDMLKTSPTMPLPCQHEFHIKCIKKWLAQKSDCPICRKFALNSDEFPSLNG